MRKMRTKYYIHAMIAKTFKIVTAPSVGKDTEQLQRSYTAGGNVRWYSHFEKPLAVAYKVKHTPNGPALSLLYSSPYGHTKSST